MNRVSMGSKGIFITGLVLLISLFFPWQNVFRGVEFFGISGNVSGFSGLGILVALLLIALLVWEGLLAGGVNINVGTMSPALISAIAGGVVVLLTLINFLTKLSGIQWGAFVGLLAALALAYASYLRFQESKMAPPPVVPPSPPPA
jgi:hypothetical protein